MNELLALRSVVNLEFFGDISFCKSSSLALAIFFLFQPLMYSVVESPKQNK